MIISVASGKGGTGKTTIAVNLALSLKNVQFLDCDVEEPNVHIFLKPRIEEKSKAFIPVPHVDKNKCTFCGKCRQVCEYNAIAVLPKSSTNTGNVLIFPELCHGCGACSILCPQQAISEVNREIGMIETGEKDGIGFTHGRLNIGEAMSPPLIRQVKKYIDPSKTVIIDAPPGTSCPVITAVKGSDFCVLVTEPTPFGLNDLVLTVEVLRKLNIPFGVVINRCDLGNNKMEEYCVSENINILMRLPFKKEIAMAYSNGCPIVEIFPQYKETFMEVFNKINHMVAGIQEKQ
ncbi:MAG: ATP-binding protein [Candidatus Margulisiibacteriota bacterium]